MLLKEYLMVICRNAGRYFSVANRSDFYHDFLRSLYDTPELPAFFDNRVECFNYYITKLGYLPSYDINDESKQERYIYFYNTDDRMISCVIISMLLYAELVLAGLREEGMKCPRSELKIMNL